MAHTTLVDLVGRVLDGRYRLLGADRCRAPAAACTSPTTSGCGGASRSRSCTRALADDGGFLRRFRAEAQMAASLHHPHVMAVYDWGEDDGVPFMVLELLEGRLAASHARHRRPPHARRRPTHVGRAGRARRSSTRTAAASSTATSSPRTSCSTSTASCASPTSALPARSPRPAGRSRRARSLGTARYVAPEQAGGASARRARRSVLARPSCSSRRARARRPVVGDTAIGTLAARAQRPIEAPLAARRARAGHRRARASPIPTSATPTRRAMGAALADVGRVLPAPEPAHAPRHR